MTRQWWEQKGSLRKGLGYRGEGNRVEMSSIKSWNHGSQEWGWRHSGDGQQVGSKHGVERQSMKLGEGGGRERREHGWLVGGAWSLSMSLRQGGSDGGWPRVIERDGQGADRRS